MQESSSRVPEAIAGTLHIFVAFDWGEEVDLSRCGQLASAEPRVLSRRRRTPSSFFFRPAPLHFDLGSMELSLAELGKVPADIRATVFDFAAVSVSMRLPFALDADRLCQVAGFLAEPSGLVEYARAALRPLYERLLPAIQKPAWHDELSEEYFVFELTPDSAQTAPEQLLAPATPGNTPLLARLVHLENGPLSSDEVAEALRLYLRYGPQDLFVPDWAAAVLVDRECEETLQAIEFANLQLLEFRHIDDRLDRTLSAAYRLVHPLTHSWLPFWRLHARPLRVLGELKVDADELFERTGNVLKLVGDPYLARVYRLLATRFHLADWQSSIQRKLEVAEGVYQVISDQAASFRLEFLEILVVVLILVELVLGLVRR